MAKTHKLMVGRTYHVVTTYILPLVFTLIGILFRAVVQAEIIELFLIVQCVLMMFEISTEYFSFGSLYRKNNFGMEYLKTSVSGIALFKKSVLEDSVIRILRTMFYTLVPGIAVIKSVEDPLLLLIFAVTLSCVSVWSVNMVRYVTMYGYLMIVTAPLMCVGVVVENICIMLPQTKIAVLILMILLLAIGVWFTQHLAEKKIRASYFDRM